MTQKPKPALDAKLLEQGVTYDEKTHEYVNPDGHRIAYDEWHETPVDLPGGKQESLTEESFLPRNVREKMSVWFDQDVLDELRRMASIPGAKKMARLINDALREAYLSEKSDLKATKAITIEDFRSNEMRLKNLEAAVEELKDQIRVRKEA